MEDFNKDNKNNFAPNSPKSIITKGRSFSLFFAMFWAFFLALALGNVVSPYFSNIISGLLSGITPLLLGIVVAFIFYRFVDFIERVVLKNAFAKSPYKFAIKRSISIFTVLLVIVGVLAVFLAILVPKIVDVVQRITAGSGDGGNQIYNNVVNEICNVAQRWFGAEVSQDTIKNVLNRVFEWFMTSVVQLRDVFTLSLNVISGLINVLLGMLVAILILKDKEKISRFCRRYSYTHFKKERADEICVITNNASKILYNYVICKIIEFVIIFVSLGIIYMILGLEFTWELALLIGIFNFIPYFGIYIGAIVAALITLIFNSVNTTLYMLIATFVICTIEFNIVLPIITGSRLKVSSLVVITSIIVGGAMFGILGMLLAPPIFAIISVVITGNIELKENHMKYVMELNKAREKNQQDEKEQLGIMPLGEELLKKKQEETKAESKEEKDKLNVEQNDSAEKEKKQEDLKEEENQKSEGENALKNKDELEQKEENKETQNTKKDASNNSKSEGIDKSKQKSSGTENVKNKAKTTANDKKTPVEKTK